MAKVYTAPFDDRRLLGNLEKFLPQVSAGNCVAFYDSTIFDNKDMGLLLTTDQVILFAKQNTPQAVRLADIDAVRSEQKDDKTYSLVFSTSEDTLQQDFTDTSLLREWLGILQQHTALEVPTLPDPKVLRHQEFLAALESEKGFLYRYVPVAPQERYLAYTRAAGFVTHPLLLTTRRLLRLNKNGFIEWSVWLSEIERFEGRNNTITVYERGKRYTANLSDALSREVFESFLQPQLEAARSA